MQSDNCTILIKLNGHHKVYSEAAYKKLECICDRPCEALEDINAEGRHARSGSTAYRMAVIARKALQEDRDDK